MNGARSSDVHAPEKAEQKRPAPYAVRLVHDAFCGLLMALADSVPGVSGGTVAFIAGIYDDFIGSFGRIIGKDRDARRNSLGFLARLGIGWVIGMAWSVAMLEKFFTQNIYRVSSLFLGLVAASVVVVIIEEHETIRDIGAPDFLFAAIGAGAVIAVSMLHLHVDVSSLTVGGGVYVFVSGALAISAMVLPGISGSTLLLASGLYIPIISGIRGLMRLDLSAFPLLCVFGVGVITGIAVSFRGLHRLLTNHRRQVIYLVIGLMLGSLYAVVMGPTTLAEAQPAVSAATFDLIFFIIGLGIIFVFEAVKRKAEHKKLTPAVADDAVESDDDDDE